MVKSRYKTLCTQLEKVSLEQRESMKSIRAALENTMKMVQALQQHAGLEVVFSFYSLLKANVYLCNLHSAVGRSFGSS